MSTPAGFHRPTALPASWSEVRPLPETVHPTIRDSVQRILKEDPRAAGAEHFAFVAMADLPGMPDAGARVAAFVNVGAVEGLSFSGYLEKRYHGPLEGGVALVFAR